MIKGEPKHWFECMFPVLEDHEEEIFFPHPVEDIKCNQLGILYFDPDRYVCYELRSGSVVREHAIWNGKKVRVVGSKLKVIWECYHHQKLEMGVHFTFLNGNPLDLTLENLMALNKMDPTTKQKAARVKTIFTKNSVDRLLKLEIKYEKKGIGKEQLHEILQLPNWLSCARKRHANPVVKKRRKKV